ncbi:TPA: DUF3440 domain-containing protein [Citrobacter freundii]|nr:DUF3440 domain-containing protein [Citrobacter freundii]
MTNTKIPLNITVSDAARQRIEWALDTFPAVCISFSGGKDSTVLFHLAAGLARQKKKTLYVLFLDWEVQFSHTINHIIRMKALYRDVISRFFWVALPLTTVSGVSQYQPEWTAWEKDTAWIRMPPDDAITDYTFFPFYRYAMTFEDFMPAFSAWLSEGKGLITLTGVRADESLSRFASLVLQRKSRYADDLPWTAVARSGHYCTGMPLYDWTAKDIWLYHATTDAPHNLLYDLMYRAGVPVKLMRVCEPFGPEQRLGLWLYHALEPERWSDICTRVTGARTGARYAHISSAFYSLNVHMSKPAHLSWRMYACFLLDSMPASTAGHYRTNIARCLEWYAARGVDIPDARENDTGTQNILSWRRICKAIIKNDYWCKMLPFRPDKPAGDTRSMRHMKNKRKV